MRKKNWWRPWSRGTWSVTCRFHEDHQLGTPKTRHCQLRQKMVCLYVLQIYLLQVGTIWTDRSTIPGRPPTCLEVGLFWCDTHMNIDRLDRFFVESTLTCFSPWLIPQSVRVGFAGDPPLAQFVFFLSFQVRNHNYGEKNQPDLEDHPIVERNPVIAMGVPR